MGATFSRLKNWTTEILSNTDLNAEIDNILNNLGPSGVDDYSTTATQMKIQTDPGSLGSESLATSLAGELERLRFVIKRIIGSSVTYWYQSSTTSLTDILNVLGSGAGLPPNRIASGMTTGNSSQLNALIPSGTTASLTLTASAVTPFTYYIANTLYSITASVTLSGLTLAAAANSTVTINKPDMTGGLQYAKSLGQYGTSIYVDNMNSGPTALVGAIAGFTATASSTTEFFTAVIESTSALTNAWRGSFFNSTPSAVPAVAFSDNDNLLLNKLTWIFANTNSSLAITYNNPSVSAAQPVSPAIGDYWYDLVTTAWKTYNGTSWGLANATLIGLSMQNSVACVAARTFDAYKATSDLQSLKLERISNIAVQAQNMYGKVSVFGNALDYGITRPTWDITTNLEAGVTESINTTYYLYLNENGSAMMTDKAPRLRMDLNGLYYPTETWRCVGSVFNDSSTNMVVPARTFKLAVMDKMFLSNPAAYRTGSTNAAFLNSNMTYPNNFATSYIVHVASTAAQSVAGTANMVNLQQVALQPGIWGLSAFIQGNTSSGTGTATYVTGGLAVDPSTAASVTVGDFDGQFTLIIPGDVTNGNLFPWTAAIPFRPVAITAAQTIYLKAIHLGSAGGTKTTSIVSSLSAIRLDRLGGDS